MERYSCLWKGRLNMSRYQSFLPTLIYRFNAISDKIPASYFVHIDKMILKFIWRDKRFRITNTILKEKNKIRRLTLHNLKTYYKPTLRKAV